MTQRVTEQRFSRLFKTAISKGAWTAHYPQLTNLVAELECLHGRPDYVGSTSVGRHYWRLGNGRGKMIVSALSSPTHVQVLSVLNPSVPRSESYLVRRTGLRSQGLKRSLHTLTSDGLVLETARSTFTLSPEIAGLRCELWAIELKLQAWRRALYQALRYQVFAHRTLVVMPEVWAHRIEENVDRFRRVGVGILAFDCDNGSLRVIQNPRKSGPTSRVHYLYALGKFLARV